MTENKNINATTEENKKAIETIVETAKKAPAKKAPAKGGIAATIANRRKKTPAAKPVQEKPVAKKSVAKPTAKMEEVKKTPAEKIDQKTEALKNSLMTLQSFAGNEKAALAATKAIASRDIDAIKAILAGLPKSERPVFMALNNAIQAEKSEKEKASRTASKLDRDTSERARVSAIVTTLFESLESMRAITRKEMKAGDIIVCDGIAFKIKAKTHEDIFCAFFEKACAENKNIARFVPDYVISNAPFPDGTRILRPATSK